MSYPKIFFSILGLFFISSAEGRETVDLQKSFPKGKGSRFELRLENGIKTEAMIYVSESNKDLVGIETYLSASGMGLPVELWMLTRFSTSSNQPVDIRDAFAWLKGNPAAEKVPVESLGASKGLALTDFILRDEAALKAMRIGKETIRVPAGEVKSDHYRKTKGAQTIDFWISPDAGPLGIVKVEAKGGTGFSMALIALISNVKAKIDPQRAVGLSPGTQTLLNVTGLHALIP